MSEQPLIFDLGKRPPTTGRWPSRSATSGGAALDQAQRRADAARYQEVTCRSALNPVKGMPFNWTLNPYRGCTHGCHYCFARRYQTQFELDPTIDFSSVIFVKTNLVEVLRRELDKPSWTREQVAVGTATDPYQPIEGHYKLTRGRSRRCSPDARRSASSRKARWSCATPTCCRSRKRCGCTVYISVPTVDEDAWRTLEPGTAHPLQRLRAVRELRDAGINAGVLMAPSFPASRRSREARSHHQGDRRSRRRVHRRQPDVPEGGHAGALHGVPAPASSRTWSTVRPAVRRRVRASATTRRQCAAMVDMLQQRYDVRATATAQRGKRAAGTRRSRARPKQKAARGTGGLRCGTDRIRARTARTRLAPDAASRRHDLPLRSSI